MEERKYSYFENPTQVKWLDLDNVDNSPIWIGGIAYHNEIICGCCGAAFEIADYLDDWEEFGKDLVEFENIEYPIVPFDFWVDISHDIADE